MTLYCCYSGKEPSGRSTLISGSQMELFQYLSRIYSTKLHLSAPGMKIDGQEFLLLLGNLKIH